MKNILYKFFMMSLDLIFFVILFFVSSLIRENISIKYEVITLKEFGFVFFILLALLYYEGIYKYRYDFWQESYKIIKVVIIAYLIVLAILTLTKTNVHYSRLFINIYFLLLILLFPPFKRVEKFLVFKKLKMFKEKVLVVGNNEQKKKLIKEIQDNWYLGMDSSNYVYDYVFIATKNLSVEKVSKLIEQYSHDNKRLYLIPYVTSINFAHSDILEYTNLRLNSIVVENKLLNKLNVFIKDLFDYLVALLILPVFLLVHLIVSILIKLDSPGSVFFKQKRVGKNGKIFYVYKYRTMYENSQSLLEEYLKQHPEEIEYYEKYHKYKNDPRITKLGKILRSTSLDELPQIINVLRGEMSLIGPRPYMLSELEKLGNYKYIILKVKPGLTGLWQVSGRNNLTFKERNELETWYIKNWSLWLDLVILIKTIKVVFLKIGAK